MLNLDIAVSSFWQLARHWKSGEKAKLELACEGGNLHLQLSAMLGHPDHVHFPTPSPVPPPSSCKRKSPSQLRRQKRRQEEAPPKADKAAAREDAASKHSEKEALEDVPTPEEAVEILSEDTPKMPAVKPAQESVPFKCDQCDHKSSCKAKLRKHVTKEHSQDPLKDARPTPILLSFQCDQCNFIGASDKGLRQHTRMSHRISQLDGNNSDSDDSDIDSLLEMVKSEPINKECFQVLGTSKQCLAYCNKIFKTKEECCKHNFLSTSQCCQTLIANLTKSGLEEAIKNVGIQQIVLKVKSVLPQL